MTSNSRGVAEKRVTRDVDPMVLRDLLQRPPRATVTFVDNDAADLLPASARFDAGTYLFGVPTDIAPKLENREVVLVIDEGPYWFELRGISVRGVARGVNPPAHGRVEGLAWYAIEPRRVLAWDYGEIREE